MHLLGGSENGFYIKRLESDKENVGGVTVCDKDGNEFDGVTGVTVTTAKEEMTTVIIEAEVAGELLGK